LRFTSRELEKMDALRGELSRPAWVRGLIDAAFAREDDPTAWLSDPSQLRFHLPLLSTEPFLSTDLGPLDDRSDDAREPSPPLPPIASGTARRFVAALAALVGGSDHETAELLQDLRLAIKDRLREGRAPEPTRDQRGRAAALCRSALDATADGEPAAVTRLIEAVIASLAALEEEEHEETRSAAG
jgi:hypothetical protein